MTTAALRISTPLPETETAPKKSFFKRVLDAMIAARMRQAQREILMHKHLLPENVRKDLGTLPFVRGA
jgi:hypothetical protein